ncbi:hypothetical protein AAE02nite_18500 [Adhaeribacter aerolatus]|uniref:Uncharacterized protein n=1 Tax=Adhaeribacter aerolatus TaxID=670289 RepID=A0A512AWT9_9BACT|nr:hypothetical protein [Adhaeribacter aerolatus]GEO04186.1 hypothetical protein AAE02nite_18500 [Adhaeribacter aerolatus]
MPWGKVTITYPPTGYTQNYKRFNVNNHIQCQNMVADAVADSLGRINIAGAVVNRINIGQQIEMNPGTNYRVI